MLIFNQGIPRSGKSYDFMRNHVLPALRKGRPVFARLNGLNYDQIAGLAGLTVPDCTRLLTHVDEAQVREIWKIDIPIGALIGIDEAQNFWPNSRSKLSPEITQWVAEHGHKGYDIVLMGQDIKDVHSLWRRRVSQLMVFNKLDMLGFPNRYSWKLSKAVSPDVFQPVSNGEEAYDKAIFGSYRSFVEGAEGNQLYSDKRASIWHSRFFKYGVPAALAAAIFGGVFLWNIFHSDKLVKGNAPISATPKTVAPVVAVAPVVSTGTTTASANTPPKVEKKYERDFIQDLSEKYRLRVSAVMQSASKTFAIFEWYDDGMRVKERLSVASLQRLGYAVEIFEAGETAAISKGAVRYVATQFPLEEIGRLSEARQRDLSGGESKSHDLYRAPSPESGSTKVAANGRRADEPSGEGYGVLGRRRDGLRQPGS